MSNKIKLNVRVDLDSPIWKESNKSEVTRKALKMYYEFGEKAKELMELLDKGAAKNDNKSSKR